MKEILDNVADFIKKLMQPMLTFVAVAVFFMYAGKQWFTSDQVFWVVGGIILFWFGYTAIKNFTYSDPKANPPITGTPGKVAGWGDCGTDSSAANWLKPDVTYDDGDVVAETINDIMAQAKKDGLEADTAYVASHIVSWLASHEDELTDAEKKELIGYGIDYAEDAYLSVTGLKKVPQTYAEVADYNKWWRNNKAACKAPAGQAKAVLMTLRDLLNRKENI
jgi:hypothetical protein